MKTNIIFFSFLKNLFDILLVIFKQLFIILLILILFPFVSLFLIIIFFEMKENPIYTQVRIGKNYKDFKIIKIKTMRSADINDKYGNAFNEQQRITKFGQILRKFKLDELLQLLNILKGDMNFFGPRPETPNLISIIEKNKTDIILSIKPGLFSYSSVKYFYEELEIKKNSITDSDYFNKLLKDKIKLNIKFVKDKSLFVNSFILINLFKKIFYK